MIPDVTEDTRRAGGVRATASFANTRNERNLVYELVMVENWNSVWVSDMIGMR